MPVAMYSAQAIVIRVRDFDEADKVVTLLTREEGKVQAVARGARRPRNRFTGGTQLFSHCQVALFPGRNLDTLSQLETVESFRRLREDLTRLAYATYACELVDEMVKEKERQEELFVLLLAFLHLMAHEEELEPVLRAFELRLLALLGYRPQLDGCVACGRPLAGVQFRFSAALGGCLCPECQAEGPVLRVARGTVETMKRLLDTDLRRLRVLRPPPETAAELARLMEAYIGWRLEKPIKSLSFLNAVRATQV